MARVRSRLRPRRRSFTLHRLWWVLKREAMLRIIFDPSDHPGRMEPCRVWFAAEPIHRLENATGDALAKYPHTRTWNPRIAERRS